MMYGWWEYGVSHPWYPMIFGPIAMLIVLAVFIFFMVAAMRGREMRHGSDSALAILKERFARGEIDRSEYEQRRQLLLKP
jgi:putative membrane protein